MYKNRKTGVVNKQVLMARGKRVSSTGTLDK